jgi:hypothetical protein
VLQAYPPATIRKPVHVPSFARFPNISSSVGKGELQIRKTGIRLVVHTTEIRDIDRGSYRDTVERTVTDSIWDWSYRELARVKLISRRRGKWPFYLFENKVRIIPSVGQGVSFDFGLSERAAERAAVLIGAHLAQLGNANALERVVRTLR